MPLSLARKYRPKRFADVAVQSHVSNTLKGAIARGRVAHGYLLCGPRGVGKTTLARVLAMALNCEHRAERTDGEPCGTCASCQRIWSGSASLDVVEIDAASNRGVDDARELRERAMYAPSSERQYKVYIVDEAHMLTREAWNALLKILEEPPPRVVFVFATTEPQKIAQAAAPVLSRLQRFDFKRIGPADVRERLSAVLEAEHIASEPDALVLLSRAADGSMRDALSLADQALALGDGMLTAARVRDALGLVPEEEYLALLDVLAARRAGDVFTTISRLVDAGVDLGGFLSGFSELVRAQLAIALGGDMPELGDRTRAALVAGRDRFTPADLLRMLNALSELEPRFRRSGQQQLLLEALLVRFALLDHTVTLEAVLKQLGNGSAGGGDERTSPVARTGATPPQPPRGVRSAERGATEHAPPSIPVARADAQPSEPAVDEPPTAPAAPLPSLTLHALVARWSEVSARLRSDGRLMLAAAIEHATPVAVTPRGDITLELAAADEVHLLGITRSTVEVLAAIGALLASPSKLQVRLAAPVAGTVPPRRLTEEAVKGERLASLRRRDPTLDAAVEALDLELLD